MWGLQLELGWETELDLALGWEWVTRLELVMDAGQWTMYRSAHLRHNL